MHLDATDLADAFTGLGTQLGTYVVPIAGFIALVTGIKLGFKWLGRYGSKA